MKKSSLPPLLTHDQLMKALSEPFPDEAHPGVDSRGMTQIVHQYEIDRLNSVFGLGGWHDKYSQEVVRDMGADQFSPLYEASCKCVLTIPRYGIRHEQNGGHVDSNRGDAEKSPKTDALGKCCQKLGIAGDVYKGLRVVQQMPKIENYGPEANGLQYSRNHKYVYVFGVVTETVVEPANDTDWLLVNGLLCLASFSDVFTIVQGLPGSTAVGKMLHAHALWEYPKKGQKFLRITHIIDIRSFDPIVIPELRESK